MNRQPDPPELVLLGPAWSASEEEIADSIFRFIEGIVEDVS